MDGLLLVDKPAGITSAGVVRVLKRRVGGSKIGHLGTLDPFATGLLPLCIGEATKVAQFLSDEDKAYSGRIRLGIETDTLDCTGRVIAEATIPPLAPGVLADLTSRFVGEGWQTPPMFSAIKQAGVPLYRMARRGIEVERRPRHIEVRALSLEAVAGQELRFSVECSKGTYVRVLASAIGKALGCGGHLAVLRRTRFGEFGIDAALPLAELEEWSGPELPVVPIRQALGRLRELTVPEHVAAVLRRGQQAVLARLPEPRCSTETAKVVTAGGEVVAIVEPDERHGRWRLARTLGVGRDWTGAAVSKLYKPRTAC